MESIGRLGLVLTARADSAVSRTAATCQPRWFSFLVMKPAVEPVDEDEAATDPVTLADHEKIMEMKKRVKHTEMTLDKCRFCGESISFESLSTHLGNCLVRLKTCPSTCSSQTTGFRKSELFRRHLLVSEKVNITSWYLLSQS